MIQEKGKELRQKLLEAVSAVASQIAKAAESLRVHPERLRRFVYGLIALAAGYFISRESALLARRLLTQSVAARKSPPSTSERGHSSTGAPQGPHIRCGSGLPLVEEPPRAKTSRRSRASRRYLVRHSVAKSYAPDAGFSRAPLFGNATPPTGRRLVGRDRRRHGRAGGDGREAGAAQYGFLRRFALKSVKRDVHAHGRRGRRRCADLRRP